MMVRLVTRSSDATLVVLGTPSACRRNACYHVGVGLGVGVADGSSQTSRAI